VKLVGIKEIMPEEEKDFGAFKLAEKKQQHLYVGVRRTFVDKEN